MPHRLVLINQSANSPHSTCSALAKDLIDNIGCNLASEHSNCVSIFTRKTTQREWSHVDISKVIRDAFPSQYLPLNCTPDRLAHFGHNEQLIDLSEGALDAELGLFIDHLRVFVQTLNSGGGPSPYEKAFDIGSGEDNRLNLHRIRRGKKSADRIDDNNQKRSVDA